MVLGFAFSQPQTALKVGRHSARRSLPPAGRWKGGETVCDVDDRRAPPFKLARRDLAHVITYYRRRPQEVSGRAYPKEETF